MESNQLPLCTLNQSKRLKELGFNWPVGYKFKKEDIEFSPNPTPTYLVYYDYVDEEWGDIGCPTIELALRWLREVKGVHGWVVARLSTSWRFGIMLIDGPILKLVSDGDKYESHDLASSALLDEILKIVNL